jgi:hypothetical protein
MSRTTRRHRHPLTILGGQRQAPEQITNGLPLSTSQVVDEQGEVRRG